MKGFFKGGRDAVLQPFLGLPSQKHVEPKDRLLFSPWRCIFHPHKAFAEDEAFAKLSLTIHQAEGLLSGDPTGLSDPFVAVLLDGEKHYSTNVLKGTLAPKWERRIDLDVHQPMSVLTLEVYDHDIGLAANLLGFIDLRLQHLPVNQRVSGWFELTHPAEYQDTIMGRLKQESAGGGSPNASAGRIRLDFELQLRRPLDELFAACLPPPSLGHGYPPMDLHDFVVTASVAAEQAKQLKAPFDEVVDGIFRRITIFWLVSVVVLWRASFILPIIILELGAVAVFVGRRLKAARAVEEGDSIQATAKSQGSSLGAGWCSETESEEEDQHHIQHNHHESGQQHHHRFHRPHCMATTTASSPGGRSPHHHHNQPGLPHHQAGHSTPASHMHSTAAGDEGHHHIPHRRPAPKPDFQGSLTLAQNMMPRSQHLSVRSAQSLVKSVNDGLTSLGEALEVHGDKVGLGSIGLAVFLWLIGEWQVTLIKAILTVMISVPICEFSAPGKLGLAAVYYYLRKKRFHVPCDSGGGLEASPVLNEEQCRELVMVGPGSRVQDMPHDLRPAKLMRVKRCNLCGRLTANGVSRTPPMRCAACKQVICRRCLPHAAANCRGTKQKGTL